MLITIYNSNKVKKAVFGVNDSSTQVKEIHSDNVLSLSFALYEHIELDVNDYVDFEGERYWLIEKYKPTQKSNQEWEYNVKLYGIESLIKRFLVLKTVDGENEPVFSLTAPARTHVALIVECINLGMGTTDWKVGEVTASGNITVDYEGTYCNEGLKKVAEASGTEWWIDGMTVNLCRCEYGEELTLGYGEGVLSIERETADNVKFYTRLFPIGSSRNIDPSRYGYNRLQLPGGARYVDVNTDKYGVIHHYEQNAFSHIYPKRVGTISSVRREEVTDEGGTQFTVYYFKDSGLSFDPNSYEIAGLVKQVTFQNGELNGREFEVNFNSETREFEIITIWPYNDGSQLPGGSLVPSVGDEYILWNIRMPDEYYPIAEAEFLAAVNEYNAAHGVDVSVYKCPTDHVWVEDTGVVFHLGRRVRLKSAEYFPETGYRRSRITKITRRVNLPSSVDLEISDVVSKSGMESIEDSISEVKSIAQTSDVSLPNIIRTWEGTPASDYNVFSALRSERMFLRKDKDDATPHRLGVGGLNFQDKPINRFIRYYDEEKPEETSDADIYSALMVDEKIKEGSKELDDRYLRKDKEDTAQKHITFEEGITVYELAKMMNLEVEQLATLARAIVQVIGSSTFVDGFFGEGWQIWKAIATEDWNFTIDRLTVRKVMTVYELIIQKIRAVGGMVVVSAANGKVKGIEEVGLEYKFTFEDMNMFCENDLMRCQVWTGTGTKYYWVEVTRVEGAEVYARVSDFGGVLPEPGDEVVLMGNTRNELRQNLILISATEDGQPRFDCLNGVKTKNFDGCLRTRVGCLDGISDDRFPADMQPKGYGLYADNCFLSGVFVLSNGKDVQTQFAILEGMIRASIASVQQQINAKDNYLNNASFSSNMGSWEFFNDVKVFRTSGGLLHFNGNLYSIKNALAGIVPKDTMNVLRLKNSYIRQTNSNLAMHPEFSLVEQTTTDEEGNEVGTGVELYRPRMFFVSFKYMVAKRGTLKVYFEGEESRSDFEEYTPVAHEEVLEVSSSFGVKEIAGKWNGTGDFRLSFDGDIYIYDLALADNALADMEERWSMQLEITDKKIQANAEHIKQQGENLEEYRSEFQLTAEELRTEFTTLIQNKEADITEAYTSLIEQTAQGLTSDYTAKIADFYGTVTEEYESRITQTAQSITAELTAKIDATNESVGDLEKGLVADYEAKIQASAEKLTSGYQAEITDLKTGDIANLQSSIEQQAGLIATKVSETEFNALSNRVSTAETAINQNAENIELRATKKEFNSLSGTVSDHESRITQNARSISAIASSIDYDSDGNITNISTSGLVLDSEFASLFSTQVSSQGIAKTAQLSAYVLETELGGLVSKIDISADQIDLTGAVSYYDLTSSMRNTIDAKAESSDLEALETSLSSSISSLNSTVAALRTDVDAKASLEKLNDYVAELEDAIRTKADSDLSNAVLNGATFIYNGYIRADYIDADNLVTKHLRTDSDSSGYKIDIEVGHIWMKDSDDNVVVQINASSYVPAVWLTDTSGNSCGMNSKGFTHSPSGGGLITITGGDITLSNTSKINSFAVGKFGTFMSGLYDLVDISTSSSVTLPTSTSYPGKVIFVKCKGEVTFKASGSDKIMPWGSYSEASSVKGDSSSLFFISNGNGLWYGFICH